MGNFFRRSSAVHPASGDGGHVDAGEQKGRLRIKVRMRRDQLEELLCLARRGGSHQSDGANNKIGFLILKECMEGRLPATVLGSGHDLSSQRSPNYLLSRRLGSIAED